MHSALLTFPTIANDEERTKHLWTILLSDIANILGHYKGIESLNENVLLIPLDSGLTALAKVISRLDGEGSSYKVLFFDEEPNWITSEVSI